MPGDGRGRVRVLRAAGERGAVARPEHARTLGQAAGEPLGAVHQPALGTRGRAPGAGGGAAAGQPTLDPLRGAGVLQGVLLPLPLPQDVPGDPVPVPEIVRATFVVHYILG